jgi:outer membrane protein OmpA-like peptidoglycan-associated protein
MSNTTPVGNPPKGTAIALLLAAIILFLIALGWDKHGELESRKSIAIFFVVPYVIQAVGLWRLKRRTTYAFWWFNCLATFLCQSVYCLLWVLYSEPDSQKSQGLSYFALFWTFVILAFVGIMTFAIMGKYGGDPSLAGNDPRATSAGGTSPDGSRPQARGQRWYGRLYQWSRGACARFFANLSAGVGEHPYWAIAFFMSLFLGVSYLFGFALAFHDKHTLAITGNEKPALHMLNLPSADDAVPKPTAETQAKAGAELSSSPTPLPSPTPNGAPVTVAEPEEFRFYFEQVDANVYRSKYGNNKNTLDNVVEALQKAVSKGRVKVTLLGHTDNEPIPNTPPVRYLSNYELSQARSQNVQYEILRLLRERLSEKRDKLEEIQWTIFPAADEHLAQIYRGVIQTAKFNDGDYTKMGVGRNVDFKQKTNRDELLRKAEAQFNPEELDGKLPQEEKRVVIASIDPIPESLILITPEQMPGITDVQKKEITALNSIQNNQEETAERNKPKSLKLMDYMYFSIYTITTTGYGDIVPTTAYAKFVTSVANIFEVIFLVVFFNAILSLKGDPELDIGMREGVRTPLPGNGATPDEREQQQPALVIPIAGRGNS